jgi:hypothetical protein
MTYLRSLFFNFLVVFFVDRVVPGLQIAYFEQVPDIGADLLFSMIVGFFNASVFPFLVLMEVDPAPLKLAIITGVISFSAFAVIAVIPFGIRVVSPSGFFLGGFIVWFVAYVSNYLESISSNPKN